MKIIDMIKSLFVLDPIDKPAAEVKKSNNVDASMKTAKKAPAKKVTAKDGTVKKAAGRPKKKPTTEN
jgi:hypothetical protein